MNRVTLKTTETETSNVSRERLGMLQRTPHLFFWEPPKDANARNAGVREQNPKGQEAKERAPKEREEVSDSKPP